MHEVLRKVISARKKREGFKEEEALGLVSENGKDLSRIRKTEVHCRPRVKKVQAYTCSCSGLQGSGEYFIMDAPHGAWG